MKIHKGDTVVVIAGKDKGKKGKVLESYPSKERVLVEGINMVSKSQKPNQKNPDGGIIKKEMPIHASNVMYFDSKSGKGTRVGYKLDNNKKVRISKSSGDVIK